MTRHFLTLTDISSEELARLLEKGASLKAGGRAGGRKPLEGKTLLMLFCKPSTRTRISFQVGMYQLGGAAIELRSQEIQMNRGESIRDTAEVFSRYADAVVIRTFGHGELTEWTAHAGIPVINGLTDRFHPCQILADIMTIHEARGSLEGLKVAYIGDGNNVLHSWITACCLVDFELVWSSPEGFDPNPSVIDEAARMGWKGRPPRLERDPLKAAEGADVIYTDVWTSMGQEAERDRRLAAFAGYQINDRLLARAGKEAVVMHCLPAHRGEEITADVADGPRSIILDQAENRLHMQKALLLFLLSGGRGPGRARKPTAV